MYSAFKNRFYEIIIQNQRTRECVKVCLLYTSDAADERSSVDLGGRRIIKKQNQETTIVARCIQEKNNEKTYQ